MVVTLLGGFVIIVEILVIGRVMLWMFLVVIHKFILIKTN